MIRKLLEIRQETMSRNEEWCNQHTLSRGSGLATGKLVGSPGGIPIRIQKWLRDKKGKSHNGRWYKKGVAMNSEKGGGGSRKKKKE